MAFDRSDNDGFMVIGKFDRHIKFLCKCEGVKRLLNCRVSPTKSEASSEKTEKKTRKRKTNEVCLFLLFGFYFLIWT